MCVFSQMLFSRESQINLRLKEANMTRAVTCVTQKAKEKRHVKWDRATSKVKTAPVTWQAYHPRSSSFKLASYRFMFPTIFWTLSARISSLNSFYGASNFYDICWLRNVARFEWWYFRLNLVTQRIIIVAIDINFMSFLPRSRRSKVSFSRWKGA